MSQAYDYANLHDFCHSEHADYQVNTGLALYRHLDCVIENEAILEFGAGNGDLSVHMESQGNRVTALEVSKVAFDRIPVGDKIHGDGIALAGLTRKFDRFVSMDVLQHLSEDDVRLVVREAARLANSILVSVSTRPSDLLGPKGENLHLTVRPAEWWSDLFSEHFDVQVFNGLVTGQVVIFGDRRPADAPRASPLHIAVGSVPIHLVIIQPVGDKGPLCFLDQARYFRHMFRRQGATVTIAKNRLREDAVNFVFGAHLGFPAQWQERHACIFVNLEQLGRGGKPVSADYLELLRRSAVVDYDAANVPAYAQNPVEVPVVSFGYAAYLDQPALPLEERPIDLLFFGVMNERRRRFIERVEAAGFQVAMPDTPLYGPERDPLIRQAKAVLNCHYYELTRFEQARVFHCLSLGTPVISEYTPTTEPTPAFVDSVLWLPDQVEDWFRQHFKTPSFYEDARQCLAAFRTDDAAHDLMDPYADLLAFAQGVWQRFTPTRASEPWRPHAINLGSGQDYKPTWLNLDTLSRAEPDLVLDLGQPLALPYEAPTRLGGTVRLEPGSVDLVYANGVLERVPDLPMLMGNVLALLKEGGELQVEVPYEKALTAWQDPTHLRALNENSWLYYTEWFWYLGWFEHRFEITHSQWLDDGRKPGAQAQAAFMRMTLRKIATTPRERTIARTMRADFGGLPDDEVDKDKSRKKKSGLSVVIPTKNHGGYLEHLISNVIFAAVSPVTDLLICNDASTDETAAILSKYAGDRRIRVFHNPQSIGAIASMSMMCAHVRTPYVMFMASDDYFFPEKMAKLFDGMLEQDAYVGFGKYVIEAGSQITELRHAGWQARSQAGSNEFCALLGFDHYAGFMVTIFKRDCLPSYGQQKSPWDLSLNHTVESDGLGEFRAHDWNLALDMARKYPDRFYFLDEYCGAFRKVSTQLSSDEKYGHTGRAAYEMAVLILKFLQDYEVREQIKNSDFIRNAVRSLFRSKVNEASAAGRESKNFVEIYKPVLLAADALLSNI